MKSFIIHKDSLLILEELTDEQAGKLFKAIANYHNGIEIDLDFGLRMAFAPFKNQFVRDLEKYNEKCERNKSNGNKGGRPKKEETETNQKNPLGYLETEKTQTNRKNPNEPYNKNNSNSNSNNIYIEKEINLINKILENNKDIKQEMEELPNTLNIDTDYYNAFLDKWNLYAEKYKNRKTKLTSLQSADKINLKSINLPITEISKALYILFNQKDIIESCLVTPKHFLYDFQKYYTAGQEYVGSKNIIQFYKP